MKSGLKRFLAADQVKCLEKSTMKGTAWSKGTLEKALKIRLSCGPRGFNLVRELGQPLPAERTLQRHLQDFKFVPGILHELMDSLAFKISVMNPKERYATLMIDEMQLTPSLVYDASIGMDVTGYPALIPATPPGSFFFMADVPHLLKNLRNHLTKGQVIYLPDDVVKNNMLPTNEVKIEYAKQLVELDSTSELKIAAHLKQSSVDPGHFEKMKVGLAFSLFNNDTAAALRLLVERQILDRDALTTACFFETIFKWFRLMTSRTTKLAVSTFDSVKHDEAVAFLRSIVNLFEAISIESSEKPVWKPIQTSIILSTTSALQDQKLYLNEMDFKFLLLSRLTQDSLENLFSTLRSKNPLPRPTEFRCALRHATMAQFLRPSKDGSYTDDQGFLLAGIPSKDAPKAGDGSIATPEELLDLELPEQESLQYLAGYVVRKQRERKKREEEARQPASQKDRLGDSAAGRAFLVGWSSVFSSRRRSAAA
ncbi:hypothetical protein HPB47_015242 [Ixodes persulcatus]|uniref:Uncharacterized protein n=1 Tax=Ixodes persulcatus TaxID=34615 RepID=A0AC60QW05_IXOPE|nr:hypothetical protein HPB47_015242 [Ixodes persulcatus]